MQCFVYLWWLSIHVGRQSFFGLVKDNETPKWISNVQVYDSHLLAFAIEFVANRNRINRHPVCTTIIY